MSFKIKKKSTDKKRAANRRNAELSTGPKTPKGKAISRYNATSHALTAGVDTIVPRVDGLLPADYDRLRSELQATHQPVGPAEQACVDEIAYALVLLRRVALWESATIRKAAAAENVPLDEHPFLAPAREELRILQVARQHIASNGSLVSSNYEEVLHLISRVLCTENNPDRVAGSDASSPVIVDAGFVESLDAAIRKINEFITMLVHQDGEKIRDHYREMAILPEKDMARIIQAENRARNKLERNLQTLAYLQMNRKSAQHDAPALPQNSRDISVH